MNSKARKASSAEEGIRNPQAFQALYLQSHLMVYRYIFGLLGGPIQDVEDLTAETYTRAWKARQRFRGDEQAALGWLLRIARNLVIDSYRRGKAHDKISNIDDHILYESQADDILVQVGILNGFQLGHYLDLQVLIRHKRLLGFFR